jgi:D-alanyl-D-alanine carboxypeptidase
MELNDDLRRMRGKYPLLASLLLLGSPGAHAAAPVASPAQRADASRRIDEVVRNLVDASRDDSVRNAVLLVDAPGAGLRHGTAAGLARGDSPAPMSIDRPFYVASITKPMVAVRILQLVESGHLSLDTTLGETGLLPADALSRLQVFEGHDYGGQITVRQLLQHRTGLRDVLLDDRDALGDTLEAGVAPGSIGGEWAAGVPRFLACRSQPGTCSADDWRALAPRHRWRAWDGAAWQRDPEDTGAGMINFFLARMGSAGLFPPGTEFHYADTNYILLGLLIEKVTGRSLDAELRDSIFLPLGMHGTYLSYSEDETSRPHRTLPADFWMGDLPVISGGLDVSFDWAGGGVVTTAADLNRFLRGVQHASVFRRSSTRDEMLACVPTPSSSGRRVGYGLGIRCVETSHGLMWGHTGAWGAAMFLFPRSDVAITGTVNGVFASGTMQAQILEAMAALEAAGLLGTTGP